MIALTPVAPRLSKLIPLLSSTHDDEVVAAARAIARMLASAGADWHDLAAALTGPAKGVEFPHPSWAAMSRPQRLDILDRLLASGRLSRWERAFVEKTYAWLHLRPSSEVSTKQRAILDELIGEVL
jgi:hypothetical protein